MNYNKESRCNSDHIGDSAFKSDAYHRQANNNCNACNTCGFIKCVCRTKHAAHKTISPNNITCKAENGHLHDNTPIAMVYSPMQQWRDLYDPYTALVQGTIFRELDLPFYPTPCNNKEGRKCRCL